MSREAAAPCRIEKHRLALEGHCSANKQQASLNAHYISSHHEQCKDQVLICSSDKPKLLPQWTLLLEAWSICFVLHVSFDLTTL